MIYKVGRISTLISLVGWFACGAPTPREPGSHFGSVPDSGAAGDGYTGGSGAGGTAGGAMNAAGTGAGGAGAIAGATSGGGMGGASTGGMNTGGATMAGGNGGTNTGGAPMAGGNGGTNAGGSMAGGSGGTAGAAGGSVTMGLVGHWKFDEGNGTKAADSSPTKNDGNLAGPAWVNTGLPPLAAGNQAALSFDGVDDSVQLTSSLSGALGATASLSAWVKTTQTCTGYAYQCPGITGAEENQSASDIFWGFTRSDGALAVQAGNGVSAATAKLNDGQWHHVVLTRDEATGAVAAYLDGTLTASGVGDVGVKTAAFSALGMVTNAEKPYFSGELDDVRVYNRVLTAAEVTRLSQGQ